MSIRHLYPWSDNSQNPLVGNSHQEAQLYPKDGEAKPSANPTLQIAPGSLTQSFGLLLLINKISGLEPEFLICT